MILYTDIDPYCCEVLRARVADGGLLLGEVWERDIRTLTESELRPFTQIHLFCGIGGIPLGMQWAGWPADRSIVTGGFPCQDVSDAGERAGIHGERSGLYAEAVRVICLFRPDHAILENVSGLYRRGLGTVLGALAEVGYDAQWDCIPSAARGALHLRPRVWITAQRADAGGVRPQGIRATAKEPGAWEQLERLVQAELRVSVPAGTSGGVADGISGRMDRLRSLGNAVDPYVVEIVARGMIAQSAPTTPIRSMQGGEK
jgi:DNA (cytosine-5)-methyltransferase 1